MEAYKRRKLEQYNTDRIDNASSVITDATLMREIVVPSYLPQNKKHMKLITWNVNGLNSLVSKNLNLLLNLVATHSPDVICLQVKKECGSF